MGAIAELYVQVGAKIDGLMSGMQDVDRRMRETSAGIDAAAGSAGGLRDIFLGGLGAELVAGALSSAMGAVSDLVGSALDHLGEVEQINAQTAAAIRSTGGAAGVTAEQVAGLANSIEAATGVSGEMIQQGENLLLTFTNLKNRAGEGNDIFTQTTTIMADMSAALGTDAKGAALQLGKALNDPIQGVSALTRVGVSFTEGQKASIKAMQEHGNIAGAQKLILAELNKEFGGSAEAFGRTWPGILEKAGAAWENFGDALLGPLMPAFKAGMATMADTVNHLADAIGNEGLLKTIGSAFGPTTLALIAGVGAAIAVHVTPAIIAAGIAAATSLPAIAAGFIAGATAAAPLIATAAAVAFAVRPILQNWSAIPGAFSAYMGLAESTILSWYQSAREVAIKAGEAFRAVAANIAGYFNKVFGGLGQELQAQWNNLPEAVRGPLSGIAGAFKGMAVEVGGAVATIPGMVAGHVKRVAGAAYQLAAPIGNEFLAVGQIAKTYLGDLGAYINSFGASTVKAFGKIGDDAGEAHAAGHKKGGKKAVSEAEKAAKAIEKTFSDLGAKLSGIGGKLAEAIAGGDLGEEIKAQTALVKTLEAALADLTKKKVSPNSAGFKDLTAQLAGASARLADLKSTWEAFGRLEGPWKAQKAAFAGFQEAMQEAKVQTLAVGAAFDTQGAKADALQKLTVGLVKAGFDPLGRILTAVREQMKGATAASKVFQEQLANAKFLEDYKTGTEQIQRRLANLGPSFAGAGEMADFARSKWKEAGGQAGLSAEQVEELRRKADETSLAAGRGGLAFEGYAAAGANASTAISNLRNGLAGIGAVVGLEMSDPLTTAASNAVELALSVGQVATSVGPAMAGIGELSTMIGQVMGSASAGPWALAAAAVVAVGASLYKLGEDATKAARVYDAEVEAIVDKTIGSGNALKVAWNQIGDLVMNIAQGFRAGIDSLFAPSAEAAKLIDQMKASMQRARIEAGKAADEYLNLHKSLTSGLDGALKSAARAFLDGTGSLSESLRTGVRDAILNGIIEATLQKGMIQAQFGGMFEDLAIAMQKGQTGKVDSLISQIGKKIPAVTAQLEGVFGSIKSTLDKAFSPTQGIMDARSKAYSDAKFQSGIGSLDAGGLLKAKVSADEKALEALRAAGAGQGGAFADLLATLNKNRADLAAAEAAAKATKDAGKKDASDAAKAIEAQQKAIREAYQGQMDAIGAKLQQVETNSTAGKGLIAQINASRAAMEAALAAAAGTIPALAAGGVTNGATMALIGEGRHREAVLPLSSDTYRQIAAGIRAESPSADRAQAAPITVHVNYYGSGKWTRDDARALGPLLVSELKAAGLGR